MSAAGCTGPPPDDVSRWIVTGIVIELWAGKVPMLDTRGVTCQSLSLPKFQATCEEVQHVVGFVMKLFVHTRAWGERCDVHVHLCASICRIEDFLGHYFFVVHTLQYATREGTRLALVGGTLNDSSGNPMSRQASIIQTIQNNAAVAVNPAALQISIFPVTGPNYSDPANWQSTTNPGNGGDFMRVVVQYTFTFWTPLIGQFFPSHQQVITAQALYRNEMF